jgi:hypothetical protein
MAAADSTITAVAVAEADSVSARMEAEAANNANVGTAVGAVDSRTAAKSTPHERHNSVRLSREAEIAEIVPTEAMKDYANRREPSDRRHPRRELK